MAKKPGSRAEFLFFNVVYDDGSQRSNRRVPSSALDGPDPDAQVREAIEQQDREIAERSGLPILSIRSISRVAR
jgi:hypothetical protein